MACSCVAPLPRNLNSGRGMGFLFCLLRGAQALYAVETYGTIVYFWGKKGLEIIM